MASQGPVTFVLVPGSFATPAEHDKVETLLQRNGQTVKHVPLLSANAGSLMPPATTQQDAEHIRAAMLSILDDESRDAVLMVHSYSGIPGSSALKGLGKSDRAAAGKSTSVLGILYVASFLPDVDQSLRTINVDHLQEPYKSGVPGDYLPPIPADFAPFIFNDLEKEEADRYFATMVRQSSDSYGGKCTYAAWKYIPSTQIIPEKDVILAVELQELMHKNAVAAGAIVKRVFVEGAGHCLNISKPQLIVEELLALAQAGGTFH